MNEKYIMIPLVSFREIQKTLFELKNLLIQIKNENKTCQNTENSPLYTSHEVMKILKISPATFYRKIKKKEILSSIKGKIIYVLKEDLDNYINIPR